MVAAIIISNGSRFAGEQPASLEKLEDMLKTYSLEEWSCTRKTTRPSNGLEIIGNFKHYSHVFDIILTEPKLINKFRKLIYRNKRDTTLA